MRATMTVIAGPLFDEGRILEEERSQPERAGRGVLYFIGREAEVEGRSNEGIEKWSKAEKA
jgi:hypothetical protein